MKIFGIVIVLALIGGAIYFFTRGAKASDEKETSTTTTTTSNSGLSGLLGGLNLSGLKLALT